MATPSYLGAGQQLSAINQGWLVRLGSFLGGSGTPLYVGAGQPAPSLGGFMRGPTPVYAAAPVKEQIAEVASTGCSAEVAEASACPIDPAALAAGQIAIVIPRDRCP